MGLRRRLALNRRFSLTDRVPIRISSWKHTGESLRRREYNTVKGCVRMFAFVYLNHVGRGESELGRDDSAINQDFSMLQSSGVFSASDDVQEAGRKRNNMNGTDGRVRPCHCVCMDVVKFLTMFYRFQWRP